LFSTLPRFRF